MQKIRAGVLLSLCVFIYGVYSKKHEHKSKDNEIDAELQKLILEEDQKKGILISTYVGDSYIAVKDGKLVGVKDFRKANMFDINVPKRMETEMQEHRNTIELMPWIKDEKFVITYNSIGNDINIEAPVKSDDLKINAKSSLTVINEVIVKGGDYPVFEIMSEQRKLCFTLDTNTEQINLQECSNGANDLQTFKFAAYGEAKENERQHNGGGMFNPRDYMVKTPVPGNPLLMTDKEGVVYSQ